MVALGYSQNGVDRRFTHVPHEDETFAWAACQLVHDKGKTLFVLVNGVRQQVQRNKLGSMDTARMVGPVWCPVANVVAERAWRLGSRKGHRSHTHFAPDTKVYCNPARWGDGYEQIMVIGRHRDSHHYAKMVINWKWLTNWRVKLVYSPPHHPLAVAS
ncbi:MAG TPA: hypothetical protein VGP82_01345, partial [Ktedonobacterales bacterium]|nr:hypothetical protein [Ktedonobacterales bacterium]